MNVVFVILSFFIVIGRKDIYFFFIQKNFYLLVG
jgi:hypothetical protein